MMKNKKKLLCLMMTVMLIVGVCASALAEKVHIRWVHEHSELSGYGQWIYEYLIPTFNAQYGDEIDLEVELIPGEDNMIEKMRMYLATDRMPEVTPEGQSLTYEFAKAGVAVDLTPFLEKDPEIYEGISDVGLAKNTIDGKIVGLPIQMTYFPMFYNVELFEKAGISQEELPFETWDDFYVALDKLVASGIKYPLAMETGDNAWCTAMFFSALIGSSSEEGMAFMRTMYPTDYNQPFIADAFAEVTNMLKKYVDPDGIGAIYAKTFTRFANEESAIMINGSWLLGDMVASDETDEAFREKIKVTSLPGNTVMKSAKYGSCIVSEDPAKQEAAYKLLRTMATEEAQYQYMLYCGVLPDNSSVKFDEKVEALYPQLVEIYNTMSEREGFEAYSRVWLPATQDELPSLFTALYYDMITPQEACERLTEAAAR